MPHYLNNQDLINWVAISKKQNKCVDELTISVTLIAERLAYQLCKLTDGTPNTRQHWRHDTNPRPELSDLQAECVCNFLSKEVWRKLDPAKGDLFAYLTAYVTNIARVMIRKQKQHINLVSKLFNEEPSNQSE